MYEKEVGRVSLCSVCVGGYISPPPLDLCHRSKQMNRGRVIGFEWGVLIGFTILLDHRQ